MISNTQIVRVAVPSPVYATFDYLPPSEDEVQSLREGMRVRVSFGRRELVGLITGFSHSSRIELKRLKRILEVIDNSPILDQNLLELLRWSSEYYHHPIGEVISSALPKRLRQGHVAAFKGEAVWKVTQRGCHVSAKEIQQAPKQYALLQQLLQFPNGLTASQIRRSQPNWHQAMQGLRRKGFVHQTHQPCLPQYSGSVDQAPELSSQQAQVVSSIGTNLHGFNPILLDGVTGSGKTEVYLKIVQAILSCGLQALILVPEIGLTPQLVTRFQQRFSMPIAVLHSGLSDVQRHCAWFMAGLGEASVVIGTRSAVFTPLLRPGLIIVDEEHDSSFKQQEGFRYNARDISVYRARQLAIPVILGSATPSLESLRNVQLQRYCHLKLRERAGGARLPELEVIDIRQQEMQDGLSQPLLQEIYRHLESDGQVLLFLNRRGFAPVLICHQCGWAATCERCDAYMTVHLAGQALRCHHCGAERSPPSHCIDCGSPDLREVGAGTERLEQRLLGLFNDTSIIRIDRDTTRRRGEMQAKLEQIQRGEHRILIGTQMLSKGHDFPDVTLVGIINVDDGLYSTDFRATERMAQLLVQVAGRAGRAGKPGKVVLQTHQPDHPLLQLLLSRGYEFFSNAALRERQSASLPPYRYMALLRAEGSDPHAPQRFLVQLRSSTPKSLCESISILGPASPPMERRSGLYRLHLLLIAEQRRPLKRLLDQWVKIFASIPGARKVRWSLDVDPVDLY